MLKTNKKNFSTKKIFFEIISEDSFLQEENI